MRDSVLTWFVERRSWWAGFSLFSVFFELPLQLRLICGAAFGSHLREQFRFQFFEVSDSHKSYAAERG